MTADRFGRRDFLVGVAGLGAVGALGAIVLPGVGPLLGDGATALPAFASTSPRSVQAYRVALAQPALLSTLACYCGCVAYAPPHRSLLDCFLKPGGGFEAHAAGCTVCQDEALEARALTSEGRTPAEVRRRIDTLFSDRGPSTDLAPRQA